MWIFEVGVLILIGYLICGIFGFRKGRRVKIEVDGFGKMKEIQLKEERTVKVLLLCIGIGIGLSLLLYLSLTFP